MGDYKYIIRLLKRTHSILDEFEILLKEEREALEQENTEEFSALVSYEAWLSRCYGRLLKLESRASLKNYFHNESIWQLYEKNKKSLVKIILEKEKLETMQAENLACLRKEFLRANLKRQIGVKVN